MTSDLQHCTACQEEYIAGVAACVECGGPLEPGPLERSPSARQRDAAPAADGMARAERLVAELPGLQADHAVRALLLEEIPCRTECQGVQKSYLPGRPPDAPLAMTLPVKIYVAEAQLEPAQEVITSLTEHDDLIGEQWSEVEAEDEADDTNNDTDDEPALGTRLEGGASAPPSQDAAVIGEDQEPAPESTTFRTIMLIVLAGIVMLFLFAR